MINSDQMKQYNAILDKLPRLQERKTVLINNINILGNQKTKSGNEEFVEELDKFDNEISKLSTVSTFLTVISALLFSVFWFSWSLVLIPRLPLMNPDFEGIVRYIGYLISILSIKLLKLPHRQNRKWVFRNARYYDREKEKKENERDNVNKLFRTNNQCMNFQEELQSVERQITLLKELETLLFTAPNIQNGDTLLNAYENISTRCADIFDELPEETKSQVRVRTEQKSSLDPE